MNATAIAGPATRVSGVRTPSSQSSGAQQHRARADPLRQQVHGHVHAPRRGVRHVVVHARIAGALRIGLGRSERPHDDAALLEHERPRGRFRLDRALLGGDVEDLRQRALLGLPHGHRFALDDLRDLARRIVEVAEDPALGRADADARRQQLVLDAVRAEVALLGGVRVRIDEELIVRTRHHARAAADARIAVQIDDAVAALEERVGRTDARARRFVALIAEHGKEEAAGVGERALLDRLHPAAVHADRNLMFGLARDRARMTADALPEVDREAVVGHAEALRDYTMRSAVKRTSARGACGRRSRRRRLQAVRAARSPSIRRIPSRARSRTRRSTAPRAPPACRSSTMMPMFSSVEPAPGWRRATARPAARNTLLIVTPVRSTRPMSSSSVESFAWLIASPARTSAPRRRSGRSTRSTFRYFTGTRADAFEAQPTIRAARRAPRTPPPPAAAGRCRSR